MSNPGGPLPLELFRARLMREVKADLSREKDDRLALRKALLSLIMMTQDGAGPIGKQFIEYLIQEFPPLAGHFSATHDHPIFGEHKVGRRYSKDQGLVLSIAKKIAEFMFKEPINAREIALLGEFIPWEMTAERYVGFYDIMGFRAFVDRHKGNHGVLHKVLEELHDVGVKAEEMHPHGGKRLHPVLDHRGSQLRIIQFSDSIIALTSNASSTAGLLIQLVSQMFFLHALRLGTVLRGTIARGMVTADFEKSIFFGQPIIDAYLLEEDQAWYGIVEHSSVQGVESGLRTDRGKIPQLQEDEIPLTVQYNVPFKSSASIEMSVINWPVFCHDFAQLDALMSHLRNEHSKKLNSYYRLTREFGREMLNQFVLR